MSSSISSLRINSPKLNRTNSSGEYSFSLHEDPEDMQIQIDSSSMPLPSMFQAGSASSSIDNEVNRSLPIYEHLPQKKITDIEFTSAIEIVNLFNCKEINKEDEKYLKTLMLFITGTFNKLESSIRIKTAQHIDEFSCLALAKDPEIFNSVVNTLANDAQNNELIANSYVLKALTQTIWLNESQELTIAQLERVLNIVVPKIDLKLSLLNIFCDFLDSLVQNKISRFSLETKNNLTSMIVTKLKAQANNIEDNDPEKEEIKFKIAYAYQASLRIGDNETNAKMIKRKLYSFFLGIKELTFAAGNIAGAVQSFGITAFVSIPNAIQNIIKSTTHFQNVFPLRERREDWYEKLNELEALILFNIFKNTNNSLEILKNDFDDLKKNKNKLPMYVIFGIIDTLKQIILHCPKEEIKGWCIEILEDYLKQSNNYSLQIKILNIFSELSRDEVIDAKIKHIVENDAIKNRYVQIKKNWDNQHPVLTGNTINLIQEGQRQFREFLTKEGNTRGLDILGVLMEPGSIDGEGTQITENTALTINLRSKASEAERNWMAERMNEAMNKAKNVIGVKMTSGAMRPGASNTIIRGNKGMEIVIPQEHKHEESLGK